MHQAEIDRLIGDGLDRYRRGEVDGALMVWEQVLAMVPGDPRVLRYVDYVRAHYDNLVAGAPAPLAELLVPFGLASSDDSDDYEISITRDPPLGERLAEPAVDDGWGLEAEQALTTAAAPPTTIELDADEPPAAGAVVALFGDDDMTTDYASLSLGRPAGLPSIDARPGPPGASRPPTFDPAEDSGEATFGDYAGRAPGPLDLDLELGPSLLPVAPRGLTGLDFHDHEPSTELTIDRTAASRKKTAQLGPRPLPGIADLSLELDLAGAAVELGIEASVPSKTAPAGRSIASRFDDSAIGIEELKLPPPPGRSFPVDDDDLGPDAAARPTATGLAGQLLALADRDRRAGESTDDVARRRINWLIERARVAAAGGDHDVVTVAIDLALAESPDSAVAQKLVHKHRDALLDCYYKYFGSLERRPIAIGDMAALGPGGLEPRAAFLLSRIDGMLTFDELLDVAGMGRLEACRHLAQLMRRGLVRSEP
ncbi:MAG: hypothetical protein IPL61_07705 [Myxococcales bacterium]|nr:hypothetical protein [Myxococcales bacterium]